MCKNYWWKTNFTIIMPFFMKFVEITIKDQLILEIMQDISIMYLIER